MSKIEEYTELAWDKDRGVIVASEDPRLGRIANLDDRNRNYPVRAILGANDTMPRAKRWYSKIRLDQGIKLDVPNWNPSACTGMSRTYDLAASPNPLRLPGVGKSRVGAYMDEKFAFSLYKLAQTLDEWPGELYEGSSVLGALKAAQAMGFVGEYRWAFGIDDVVLALSYVGPVVVGTDWLNSMFDPKPSGLMEVDANSGVAGGHAYMWDQVILSKATMQNYLGKGEHIREQDILLAGEQSWGESWGRKGRYLVWASDMEALLKGFESPGEAAITTQAFHR